MGASDALAEVRARAGANNAVFSLPAANECASSLLTLYCENTKLIIGGVELFILLQKLTVTHTAKN